MRRALTGIMLLMFVAVGLQVPLHAHYCGSELQDWQLYAAADSCCSHEKHNKAHYTAPCCKEKQTHVELPDYSYNKKTTSQLNTQVTPYQEERVTYLKKHFKKGKQPTVPGPAPPSVPRFLLYANFRL